MKKEKEDADEEEEEEEEEEEYEVQSILDWRVRGSMDEFLVEWKGYRTADATWEPLDNLEGYARQMAFRVKAAKLAAKSRSAADNHEAKGKEAKRKQQAVADEDPNKQSRKVKDVKRPKKEEHQEEEEEDDEEEEMVVAKRAKDLEVVELEEVGETDGPEEEDTAEYVVKSILGHKGQGRSVSRARCSLGLLHSAPAPAAASAAVQALGRVGGVPHRRGHMGAARQLPGLLRFQDGGAIPQEEGSRDRAGALPAHVESTLWVPSAHACSRNSWRPQ